MRIKWLLIAISTIAIVSLIFPITFVAADSLVTNMNSAQNSGQTWLEHIISISPEESHSWAGAYLKNGQTCYDLNGDPDAYLFAIDNNGIVGHVIVGGANYGFPVFEAGESAPHQIPSAQLIQSTVEKSLGLVVNLNDIGKPIKLLYLGVDSLFVLHNINGNLIATNLIFGKSERYSNLKSYLAAPSEYLAHKLSVDNATSSNIGPLWPSHVEFTEMYYYRDDNNGQTQCGPRYNQKVWK